MEHFIAEAKEFIFGILFKNIPAILIAIVVLFVGWRIIKWAVKLINKVMKKRNLEASLQNFLSSLVDVALKTLLIVTAISIVGIPVTSFVAILGAASLAVGMALQGTLQNFAGGVIILLLKPYKVGDFIEQGSFTGTVQKIQIFNTILSTLDNKVIIIPNTQLATTSLINYTKSEVRRVDIKIGIAYGEDINKARAALLELPAASDKILYKPEAPDDPAVVVTDLAESSVNLVLRVWVKTADYWTVDSAFKQAAYEKFNEKNIEIPFNQLQVHINQ
ncbi:MAG: mechanosensitive ion channel [Bacteroidales bacterium]|nr:mechanosensitive ion channel [Bacteroidales bacterium]